MTTIQNDSAIPFSSDELQSDQLSSPTKRLVAVVIDSLISGAIVIGIGCYIAGSFDAWTAWQKTFSPLQIFLDNLAGFSLFLVLHGYLLARHGQTIGKWFCGIRIVRTDGSKAGFGRILMLREVPLFLLAAIPLPFIFVVLATIDALFIFRSSRQCLHDQIADTIVVNI